MGQWYQELDFKKYPLDPRSNPNLIGVDEIEQRLKDYIQQGNMCLLSGPTGSGKTSMLKRIIAANELKDYKFIYITADGVKSDYDIVDAITDHTTFWSRIIMAKPRNLVILLDECQLATRILTESIKSKWNVEYPDGTKCIQSVVVSQIPDRLGTNFSGSFADRLGQRLIIMPKLKGDDLKKVLVTRLDNGKRNFADSFSREGLDFLISNAHGSVRQLLEYTDAVFRMHNSFDTNPIKDATYRISKEAVFNALQQSGAVLDDDGDIKKIIKSINGSKRLQEVVEMYEQFGELSNVQLAEKMDIYKSNADSLIRQLKKYEAVVMTQEKDEERFFVLAPKLAHALVKA